MTCTISCRNIFQDKALIRLFANCLLQLDLPVDHLFDIFGPKHAGAAGSDRAAKACVSLVDGAFCATLGILGWFARVALLEASHFTIPTLLAGTHSHRGSSETAPGRFDQQFTAATISVVLHSHNQQDAHRVVAISSPDCRHRTPPCLLRTHRQPQGHSCRVYRWSLRSIGNQAQSHRCWNSHHLHSTDQSFISLTPSRAPFCVFPSSQFSDSDFLLSPQTVFSNTYTDPDS